VELRGLEPLAFGMQTTGGVLFAVKRRSPARVWMAVQDSRSAHGLLYPPAVRDGSCRPEHRQGRVDISSFTTVEAHSEGPMTSSGIVDTEQFWELIEDARRQVPDATNSQAVAGRATALLSVHPLEEIVAAGPVLRKLLAESYRAPLWAAAYMINGGCSNDGFDDFRGWLIVQGRARFERIVTDPDALADLPVIRAERPAAERFECEGMLYIASMAYWQATGEDYPDCVFTIRDPDLDPGWDFDFSDRTEMRRRLPRLAALCLD
jgi:Protein of unknown function (DUF4240)